MLFCRESHAWILRDCVVPDRYETDKRRVFVRKFFHFVLCLFWIESVQ